MKVIGLLGGTSWVSTLEYYTLLNQGVNARLGGSHSAKLILHSFDFAEVSVPLMEGKYEAVIAAFADAGKRLERAGAEGLLICANSFHAVIEEVRAEVGVPIISIVDAVGDNLSAWGAKTVGMMGTLTTMDGEFYPAHLSKLGMKMIVPEGDAKAETHRTIAEELTREIYLDSTRDFYIDHMKKLQARGADAVIMGCTEIPLLISQEMVPVRLVDTVRAHCDAALKFAFNEA